MTWMDFVESPDDGSVTRVSTETLDRSKWCSVSVSGSAVEVEGDSTEIERVCELSSPFFLDIVVDRKGFCSWLSDEYPHEAVIM